MRSWCALRTILEPSTMSQEWMWDLRRKIRLRAPPWLLILSGFLLMMLIGVLFGLARAYPTKPWSYWLSPLADLPVILRIIQFALRKHHSWRGRTYVRRKGGTFEPLRQSD